MTNYSSLASPEKDAYYLNDWLAISDVEKTLYLINSHFATETTVEEIKDRVQFLSNVVYYFNDDLRITTRERALFAWVDTGVKTNNGEIVWLHCIKSYGVFYCKLLGSGDFLTTKISLCSPHNVKTLRKNIHDFLAKYQKQDNTIPVLQEDSCEAEPLVLEIKEKLLFDNWKTPTGLQTALLIYGARAKELVSKNRHEFYVKNNKGSVIINTGLLDKFGEPIYVMYRHNLARDSYLPYLHIINKSQYIENNFTKEDTRPLRPISFDGQDMPLFSTNLMDYDTNFEHCVSERRDRFPDSVKDATDLYLSQRIRSELELGLKIHKSGGYAKPNYKPKEQELQWLLPLHINTAIHEEPELVMAIRRRNGFYEVATILSYDDSIKDKIRAVQPYENLW